MPVGEHGVLVKLRRRHTDRSFLPQHRKQVLVAAAAAAAATIAAKSMWSRSACCVMRVT